MKRRPLYSGLVVAATLLCPGLSFAQAPPSGKLEPTTASADARATYWAALDDANNVYPSRAEARAKKAVALDTTFGLARVLYASIATDLTAAQREQELNRGVADASRASTGELIMAAAMRAARLGRTAEASVLADFATSLMPNDANVALFRAQNLIATARPDALRDVMKKFSTFAPPVNSVAYQQWNAGERTTALETVQQYVRLAPQHPNSHDSFAELLQFSNRLPEALQHYQKAVDLEPSYAVGYAGLGEVHMLMGHGDLARAAYAQAAEKSATPTLRANQLSAGALTYMIDGKSKDALRELASLAATAEQQDRKPQAAGIYRTSALIEAAFGDRKLVAGHLAKAAALGGGDIPPQHRFTALAYALTGQLDLAKAAAVKFNEAAASGTAAQKNNAREVNAVIAIAEKDLVRGRAELDQAGLAPFGKAILADALKKTGNKTDAQALRDQILNGGGATGFDVLARWKVQKI